MNEETLAIASITMTQLAERIGSIPPAVARDVVNRLYAAVGDYAIKSEVPTPYVVLAHAEVEIARVMADVCERLDEPLKELYRARAGAMAHMQQVYEEQQAAERAEANNDG